MRLKIINRNLGLPLRTLFRLLELLAGRRFPDIVRTSLYRREFFGDHMMSWSQAALRGPSGWSVAERETFAAFVSNLNQCRY